MTIFLKQEAAAIAIAMQVWNAWHMCVWSEKDDTLGTLGMGPGCPRKIHPSPSRRRRRRPPDCGIGT